ncbi:MAG TPA: glutamine-hydrolyzing carbamoyl-phosphate synthase small subunit [Thermoplasmata archaeon]|nr:glutamine-hydrolyzing carbamoyl-phosphate synthase small subunit [Thermoplasmata archaeon]
MPPAEPESALGGTLFLEDGSRFDGVGFGARARHVGEVVFTTGMVGYPETLTDPSFRGQILTFTYPLLGNYGVPRRGVVDSNGLPVGFESSSIQVRGMIARGLTAPHHWESVGTLPSWLEEEGVPGVCGIDTRRLTEHLRTEGVVRGIIDVGPPEDRPSSEELLREIAQAPSYADEKYMGAVSPRAPEILGGGRGPLVAVLDCGIKTSILRALIERGTSVLRLPYDHEVPARFEGRRVSGLLVGNGPGDPEQLARTVEELRRPSTRALPTLGICLGLQLIALARGASTYKMKFGHRGQNKTIVFPDGRALIVSENHGYAVDPKSFKPSGLRAWGMNPDDGTLEGLRDPRGNTFALQGHPEGHPGPQEAGFVFDQFVGKVKRRA